MFNHANNFLMGRYFHYLVRLYILIPYSVIWRTVCINCYQYILLFIFDFPKYIRHIFIESILNISTNAALGYKSPKESETCSVKRYLCTFGYIYIPLNFAPASFVCIPHYNERSTICQYVPYWVICDVEIIENLSNLSS